MVDDPMPELDPRFDPAFQRGGAGRAVRPRATSPAEAPVLPPPLPTAALPTVTHVDPAARPEPLATDALLAALDDELDEGDGFDDDGSSAAGRSTGWEALILVTGVLLVVGAALLWWVGMGFRGPMEVSDLQFVLVQLSFAAAAPMFTVGLAALVGVLFLRATAARRAS